MTEGKTIDLKILIKWKFEITWAYEKSLLYLYYYYNYCLDRIYFLR